ncbi:MAG TPA: Crp/Fnr family transcriptional regulator [Baekduia sp.]|nr:Crp/Fnr family transcriptional regulator [Baekduia sp.]
MSTADETTVRLLDVDPGLGARLRDDDRLEARERLTLRTTIVPAGTSPLQNALMSGHAAGLVVLSGLLLDETQIDDHPSVRVLGPGDLAMPRRAASESLSVEVRWTAATDTCVAVLDDRLQQPFAMWPGLALGFFDRLADQLARADVHKAIAQLPRVEDRLEAMLWDLADRFGRVTPEGIHIPLRLTHDLLARLVGGRRPTISLALGVLAQRGVVVRRADGSWLLTAGQPSFAPARVGAAPRAGWVEPVMDESQAQADEREVAAMAREELAAIVRRIREQHERSARRLMEDRERYEDTRRRSRRLRLMTARERSARDAARITDS